MIGSAEYKHLVSNRKAGFSHHFIKVFFVFCSSSLALALVKECQVLLTYKQFIMNTTIIHLVTEENVLALKTFEYQSRNITKTKDIYTSRR